MNISKKIGLFFGSFNPVHIGHMIIAEFMASQSSLDEVWMVISPHNPHKNRSSLAPDYDRLQLIHEAIGDNIKIKASNIEFGLPKPSYTVDTLAYLSEKYTHHEFHLIMGADNLNTLHKWKNYEILLERYHIFVYHRGGYEITQFTEHSHVTILNNVPMMHISASYIRTLIREGKSIRYLVPRAVEKYIDATGMYLQI